MLVEVIVGVALAVPFLAIARRSGPRDEARLYALGLVVAAIIYAAFAAVGGADGRWTAIELAGIVPYGVLAWLGLRVSPWWLAVGWAGHAVWDVGLHLVAGTPAFVPAWYPVACIGFDLFVGVAIGMRVRSRRRLAAEAA